MIGNSQYQFRDSQMIFKTTAEERVRLAEVVTKMKAEGVPVEFLAAVMELAQDDQGVFDLVALWEEAHEAAEIEERNEALADLHDLVEDAVSLPSAPKEKPCSRVEAPKVVGNE